MLKRDVKWRCFRGHLAFHPDLAAHELDQAGTDGQAQPGAPCFWWWNRRLAPKGSNTSGAFPGAMPQPESATLKCSSTDSPTCDSSCTRTRMTPAL